jgi:hypothetical protein
MFCALVFQGLSGLFLGLGVFLGGKIVFGVSVCVLDVWLVWLDGLFRMVFSGWARWGLGSVSALVLVLVS